MRLLDRLEQRLRPYAVPNVTAGLIAVQVLTFALAQVRPAAVGEIQLVPERVLAGEWWRLFTFLAMPPVVGRSALGPIWAFFAWYMFYLMGTALEGFWGAFRYNVFLTVGYVATVAAALLTPEMPATNVFLAGSVFLAFAFLYPDFQLLLFFILPVKIKWIALATWLWYGVQIAFGDWTTRALVLASICNFFLFFGRELVERVSTGRRRMAMQAARVAAAKEPPYRHKCAVCGITDRTHPQAEFRYCSKCAGGPAYCGDHLRNHEHVTEPGATARP